MNKQEYISSLENDLNFIIHDYKFNNYKKQIFAWRLKADFSRTYDEQYLWNRALYLTSNACFLLKNDGNKRIALTSLKESAEIYEYLSEISEKFDKDYMLLLSALCYDLSGYQANGFCVANKLSEYSLISEDENINIKSDNLIIEQIRLILLKRIPFANYKIKKDKFDYDFGLELFYNAVSKWYDYVLSLKESDYISELHKTYKFYLLTGNVYLSHLILLLEARLVLFDERSIWSNLKRNRDISHHPYWQKYVKLLAHDLYLSNNIKEIEDRNSKFEFWTSQLRAIEKGFLDLDENFVVQMPTSAGKTFIAELSILKYLIKYPDKKCIYVAPFRALTSEKENEISQYFSKLGYSVSSLAGSYEIDEFQDVILDQTDVLIATPEKIDLLLRISPNFFDNISFLVIDEGHIVGDISTRASLLEFLIIRLRIKQSNLRTLFISAVMPPENANEYALWLSGKENNVLRSLQFIDSGVNEEWEPTRKLIGSFSWVGNTGRTTFKDVITEDEKTQKRQDAFIPSYLTIKEFGNRYPNKDKKKETAAALAYKLSEEGNTLVFCAQVPRIKSVANSFLDILSVLNSNDIPARFVLNEKKASSYYAKIWYGDDSFITKAINRGIGIHFGAMPEQVRNAVENDFRSGIIKVLLSTNTIGQGLNLPVKNIVFYETQIDRKNNENKYIQNQDFWNIVGRAGKETEGKIIFIINSSTDRRLYEKFTNKGNIEYANSLFFKVLKALIDNRINDDKFNEYISILSEPYLLDLITEEILETDCEEIIKNIINNSLFKIQIDKRNYSIEPITKNFRAIFNSFKEKASIKQLNIYGKTGFSFKSNKAIDDYIEQNKDELIEIIDNDDYVRLLQKFLELVDENVLNELNSDKLKKIGLSTVDSFEIIKKWIRGDSIQEIQNEWKKIDKVETLNVFVSEALYYLYPWGITTFLTILSFKFDIEIRELAENIKSLTSFVKYGLNIPTACLARSLGIKRRQVSLFLYENSDHLRGKAFTKWLSNLTFEEIDKFSFSEFDKNNIQDIAIKLTPNSFREIPVSFEFFIKGTSFELSWRETSKTLKIGEELNYERDYQNSFDPYAIKIVRDKNPIGFVPREYAKVIASEIDLNETNYKIIIKEIQENDEYNIIRVLMNNNLYYE